MNSVDRSALHQMSFALLRRFDVITFSPPTIEILNVIYAREAENFNGTFPSWGGNNNARNINRRYLLAAIESCAKETLNQLIIDGVIGVSTLKDVILFVSKIFTVQNNTVNLDGIGNGENAANRMALSAVTLALVVKIIPQLSAAESKIKASLNHIRGRLNSPNNGFVKFRFSNNNNLHCSDGAISCWEFFCNELRLTYQHTHLINVIDVVIPQQHAQQAI